MESRKEMNTLIGHGFVAPDFILEKEHVFGSQKIPDVVIQDDGNWLPFAPEAEWQARREFDTFACTIYNTTKPIQTLERKKYGTVSNYAERHPYIGLGITPPGANPHDVSEWIRGSGMCLETSLPFDGSVTSLQLYRMPSPLPDSLVEEGKKWLEQYAYLHEWCMLPTHDIKEKHERLKEELRRGTVSVSVCGWREKNGIYYKEDGDRDNHWTFLIAYIDDFPIVLDSYPPFIKKLDKSYNFELAKRHYIEKKVQYKPIAKPKMTWFDRFKYYFKDALQPV